MAVCCRHRSRLCFMLVHLLLCLLLFVSFVSSSSNDPYRVLGLERTTTQRKIKQRYNELAMRYHPDRVSVSGLVMADAEKQMAIINDAYEKIGTLEARMQYDAQSAPNAGRSGAGGSSWHFFYEQQQRRMDDYINMRGAYLFPATIRITNENVDTLLHLNSVPSQLRVTELFVLCIYDDTTNNAIIRELADRLDYFAPYIAVGTLHVRFEARAVQHIGIRQYPSLYVRALGERQTSRTMLLNHNNVPAMMNWIAESFKGDVDIMVPRKSSSTYSLDYALSQQLEKLEAQRATDRNVNAFIISKSSIPGLKVRLLQDYYKDVIQFHHICIARLQSSGIATLRSHFIVNLDELPILIIRREPGVKDIIFTSELRENVEIDDLIATVRPYSLLKVPELKSSNFYELCYSRINQPCLLAFEQHSSDFSVRRVLVSVAADDVQYGWIDSSSQNRLYQFYVNASNYQKVYLVLVNMHKNRFSIYPADSELSQQAIEEWLHGTLSGALPMQFKADGLPYLQSHVSFRDFMSHGLFLLSRPLSILSNTLWFVFDNFLSFVPLFVVLMMLFSRTTF